MNRVAVIGLDCAAPELVFRQFRIDLPNISRLIAAGEPRLLRSSHPPITVPAWTCMMSGCDAGQLGIYGFRNRRDYTYGAYAIANSLAVHRERPWDTLSRAGLRSVVLGVPPTFPVQPLNGCLVSDFLTPSNKNEYTYPPELKQEVERVSGGYVFDAEGFRTEDKRALLRRIYEKTRKHFVVARHLAKTRAWDFFMMVEMGVDRMHHACETVYLGAWRRATLLELGDFAEVNEDTEMCYRLRRTGRRVLVSPRIRLRYVARHSLCGLARQYAWYGRARMRTLVHHPDAWQWRQLAPPVLLAGLLLSAIAFPFSRYCALALPAVYLAADVVASSHVALRKGLKYWPGVLVAFPVMHISWAVGACTGMARFGVPWSSIRSLCSRAVGRCRSASSEIDPA